MLVKIVPSPTRPASCSDFSRMAPTYSGRNSCRRHLHLHFFQINLVAVGGYHFTAQKLAYSRHGFFQGFDGRFRRCPNLRHPGIHAVTEARVETAREGARQGGNFHGGKQRVVSFHGDQADAHFKRLCGR